MNRIAPSFIVRRHPVAPLTHMSPPGSNSRHRALYRRFARLVYTPWGYGDDVTQLHGHHAAADRAGGAGSGAAAATDHGHGHGDHVAMFRRRFWVCALLTVPVVATSTAVMDWFGYRIDWPGISWV